MKTIKESAEEWSTANVNATGYDPMMLIVWRAGATQAYLAGAKYALEMAADDMKRRDREAAAKIIRSLIPE